MSVALYSNTRSGDVGWLVGIKTQRIVNRRSVGYGADMTTYTEIIDRWPSLTAYAADIGVRYGTAQVMRYRGSIPAKYWKRVVAAAARRGIDGVSLELLASIEAEPKPRRPDSNQGARSAA
jgi:hypothetical protein